MWTLCKVYQFSASQCFCVQAYAAVSALTLWWVLKVGHDWEACQTKSKGSQELSVMLFGGLRPLEHLPGLPKPLWIVVFCWLKRVDSFLTLGMTCFTRLGDGLQRHVGMRLFKCLARMKWNI